MFVEGVGEGEEGQAVFDVEDLVEEGADQAAVVGQVLVGVVGLFEEARPLEGVAAAAGQRRGLLLLLLLEVVGDDLVEASDCFELEEGLGWVGLAVEAALVEVE